MIVVPDKLVIVTPPKCGTTSLTAALVSRLVKGVRILGPHPDGTKGPHTMDIPREYDNLPVVVPIRHPAQRVYSQWSHLVTRWPEVSRKHKPSVPPSFEEFVQLIENNEYKYWFFTWAQAEWWYPMCDGEVKNLDGFIRTNCLQVDLKKFGVNASVPHLNKSRCSDRNNAATSVWQKYLSQRDEAEVEVIQVINKMEYSSNARRTDAPGRQS